MDPIQHGFEGRSQLSQGYNRQVVLTWIRFLLGGASISPSSNTTEMNQMAPKVPLQILPHLPLAGVVTSRVHRGSVACSRIFRRGTRLL